ncbi:Coiled-coil domain-containing protein R3HCC1L [Halotydeus destructor]|nr:Coiled-coil domain-containing protein R3HCC1L [Halotydeus destructor]
MAHSDRDVVDECTEKLGDWKGLNDSLDDDHVDIPNVLEIYGFDQSLKTGDISTALIMSGSKEFTIKWIDDTHALAVFPNTSLANQAVDQIYPNLKLRTMNEATSSSKSIAKRWANDLLPRKPRPQTSAIAAHRLVTSSLGIKSSVSSEQRQAERKKLQEAKEKRRQTKQQAVDAWEGNF